MLVTGGLSKLTIDGIPGGGAAGCCVLVWQTVVAAARKVTNTAPENSLI
jgi:hypothetical protein